MVITNAKFIFLIFSLFVICQEVCEPGKFANNEIFNLLKKNLEKIRSINGSLPGNAPRITTRSWAKTKDCKILGLISHSAKPFLVDGTSFTVTPVYSLEFSKTLGFNIVFEEIESLELTPEGKFYGSFKLAQEKGFKILAGDRVIDFNDTQKKAIVTDVDSFTITADGRVAGSVNFKYGPEVPFLGDQLLTELEGQSIKDCKVIAVIKPNILAGIVEFEGQFEKYPFIGNKVIKRVANRTIKKAMSINFLDSSLFFGYLIDVNHKPILVWGDKILEELKEEINTVLVLRGKNSDYGVTAVNLKRGEGFYYLNDQKISKIEGEEIKNILQISSTFKAPPVGIAKLKRKGVVAFRGDQIIQILNNHKVKEFKHIFELPSGDIAGSAVLETGDVVVFKGESMLKSPFEESMSITGISHLPDGSLQIVFYPTHSQPAVTTLENADFSEQKIIIWNGAEYIYW